MHTERETDCFQTCHFFIHFQRHSNIKRLPLGEQQTAQLHGTSKTTTALRLLLFRTFGTLAVTFSIFIAFIRNRLCQYDNLLNGILKNKEIQQQKGFSNHIRI